MGTGFGSSAFGSNPMGVWDWSRRVLYESAPTIYRTNQPEGDFFRKYSEGQQPSFERLRERIAAIEALREPLRARTKADTYSTFTLGKQLQVTSKVEQAGTLGRVTTAAVFTAGDTYTRFSSADIGKQLHIRRSSVSSNNQQNFVITAVLNSNEVYTEPPIALDAGPMRWELRAIEALPEGQVEVEIRGGDPSLLRPGWTLTDGSGLFEVVSRQVFPQSVTTPSLLTEREGVDGLIQHPVTGTFVLSSASYAFQEQDVGKRVFIEDTTTPRNTGLWEITAIRQGAAVFGRLLVQGSIPNAYLQYSYGADADRPVAVEHIYRREPNVPLSIDYNLDNPERLDVRIQLATASAPLPVPTTLSTDIIAAIAADPLLSTYLQAAQPEGLSGSSFTVSEQPLTLIPEGYLATGGPCYWAMRSFARVVLKGGTPLGVIDGEWTNVEVAASNQVICSSNPFKPGDVGKRLTLSGSLVGNNGTYEITAVSASTPYLAQIDATLTTTGEALYLYAARRTNPRFVRDPALPNPTTVEVAAWDQPLLNILATDFGTDVDTQQTEVRQRNWVRQSSEMAVLKGTPTAVEGAALLSGFQAATSSLFSVNPAIGTPADAALTFLSLSGRVYIGTSITTALGLYYLSAPSGTFTTSDVGRIVHVTTIANNNYFLIESVVSSAQVQISNSSIGANLGPIASPAVEYGSIPFAIGNLYTTILPAYPAIDDVNYDMLSDMCDLAGYSLNSRPGLDFSCITHPIKIGTDPNGYGKASLDCGPLDSGEYNAVLEARVAGTNGNSLQLALVSGAAFTANKTGNLITVTFVPGVSLPSWVDNVLSGIAISAIDTSFGDVRITTITPHGLIAGAQIRVMEVLPPTEANGLWYADVLSATEVRLLNSSMQPIFGASPYLGGGDVHHAAIYDAVTIKADNTAIAALTDGFSAATFSGGIGRNPPEVVSLNPPIGLVVTGVAGPIGSTYLVFVQGEDTAAVLNGPWKLVDSTGTNFFLDDIPTLDMGAPTWEYRFHTTASVAPSLGNAYFEYVCTPTYSCDSCASNKALIEVTADQVTTEGAIALDNAFERVIARIDAVLPVTTQASYALREYFQTFPLTTATPSTLPAIPVKMIWTSYAMSTYPSGITLSDIGAFRVGLGGYTPEGDIRPPDFTLTDLDIITNYSTRYAVDYPVPPYTPLFFTKLLYGSLTQLTVAGGTVIRASCMLDLAEFNSDGQGNPLIRELGIYDGSGYMIAYATFGGISKQADRTVTFEVELVN